MPPLRRLWKLSSVVALSVLAATAAAWGLRPILDEEVPYLPFTLAVVICAAYGGFYSGLSATILSFAIADYYFIEPLHTFFPVQGSEIRLLILFLAVGITISLLHRALSSANAAIQSTRERNELAAAIGKIGFVEFTAPDRLEFSPDAERLFGLEPGRFEGTCDAWMKLVHPEDRERVGETRRRAIGNRDPEMTYSYRALLPGGGIRWIEGRHRLFYSPNGELIRILGAKIDVTDRELLERALNEKTNELAVSNLKLDHYAHTVSHDLREPLRGVAMLTEMLLRRIAPSSDRDAAGMLNLIKDSVQRMDRLTRDLLQAAEAGNARDARVDEVNMDAVLDMARNDLRPRIEETCATITASSLPTILGRQTELLQLLENLIANAMKYRGNRAPEIRIASEADDGCWKFSVQDNGVGINLAGQQSIFEMFHRLDPEAGPEGSGLGLAICKDIVERHGGHIWVESQPGVGSTFYFTLPMAGTPRKEPCSERNAANGAITAKA